MAIKKNTVKETIKRKGSVATECRDIKIFNLCQAGYSRSELAKIYSLSPNSISRILKNIEENLKNGFYSSEHPEYLPLVITSKYCKSYRGPICGIPYQLYIVIDYRMIEATDKKRKLIAKENIYKISKNNCVYADDDTVETLYDYQEEKTHKCSGRCPSGKGKKNGK